MNIKIVVHEAEEGRLLGRSPGPARLRQPGRDHGRAARQHARGDSGLARHGTGPSRSSRDTRQLAKFRLFEGLSGMDGGPNAPVLLARAGGPAPEAAATRTSNA
jgi:hypothetical protein